MPDVGEHLLPCSSTAVRWQDMLCTTCHVRLCAHHCTPRNQSHIVPLETLA